MLQNVWCGIGKKQHDVKDERREEKEGETKRVLKYSTVCCVDKKGAG